MSYQQNELMIICNLAEIKNIPVNSLHLFITVVLSGKKHENTGAPADIITEFAQLLQFQLLPVLTMSFLVTQG